MSFFKIKRPWTRQPPANTQIDKSNPLTRGLVLAFHGNNIGVDSLYDSVRNTTDEWQLNASGGGVTKPILLPTDEGLALSNSIDERYYWKHSSIGPNGQSKASMLVRFRVTEAANNGAMPLGAGESGNSGQNVFCIKAYSDYISIAVVTSSGFSQVNDATPVPNGEWITFVAVFDGDTGTFYGYRDGVQVIDSGGITNNSIVDSVGTNFYKIANGDSGDSNREFDGDVLIGAVWHGVALTDEEAIELSENPWQIFKPETVYYPLAQAAAPAGSLYFPIKRPWTRQPPPGTRLDLSNPIVQAAAIIIPGNEGGPGHSVVYENGRPLLRETGSTVTQQASSLGLLKQYGAASTDNWVSAPNYQFPTSDTAPLTVLWAGRWDGGAGAFTGGAWRVDCETVAPQGAMFCFYNDGGSSYAPVTVGNYAESSTGFRADGMSVADVREEHAMVFRLDGSWDSKTGADFWINGNHFTGTTSAGLAAPSSKDSRIGVGSSTGTYMDGLVGPFIFCPSALPEELCRSFSENPWQIFEPETVWYKIGAAGEEQTIFITSVDVDDAWVDGTNGLIALGGGFL